MNTTKTTIDKSHYQNLPFEIPENWMWESIGNLCSSLQYGTSEKSLTEGKVVVLRMGNISHLGELNYDDLVFTSNDDDIAKYTLISGDLLFNRTNSSEWVGKTAIYRGEIPAIYAGYIIRFRPIFLNLEYVNYVMNSNYEKEYCQSIKTDGVNQSNINSQKLAKFLTPIPPLQEQERIVSIIESTFALIDEIESNKLSLAQFIKQAKSKVLELAIRGKLIPQNPNDETASVLLEKIRNEQNTKKSASDNLHYPFEIPEGWIKCELGEILEYEQPTKYIVNSTEYSDEYKIPVLTAGKSFIIGYTNEEFGIYNATPVIIFDDFTTESKYVDFYFKVKSSAMKILSTNKEISNIKFMYYIMQTIDFYNDTHKRYWISAYSKCIIFLPPLAEQKRIVSKIEEIFAQLDEIEKSIKA